MSEKLSIPELPINASPVADHRRQMLVQVWLPLAISILVVVVLIILTIVGAAQGSPQINKWGNISAILVILPVLLVGTLLLAIVGGLIYLTGRILRRMPDWMLRIQLRLVHISLIVRRVADSATKPVLGVNTFSARARKLWNKIVHGR